MNPRAEEMQMNAERFRAWAAQGGVRLSPSCLLVLAEALEDAARELWLRQWATLGGPPKPIPPECVDLAAERRRRGML